LHAVDIGFFHFPLGFGGLGLFHGLLGDFIEFIQAGFEFRRGFGAFGRFQCLSQRTHVVFNIHFGLRGGDAKTQCGDGDEVHDFLHCVLLFWAES